MKKIRMLAAHAAILAALLVVSPLAFAQDWLYVPNSYTDTKGATWGTISDGNWTLCVTASGTGLTTKGEGNTTAVPPFPVAGTGALDLSKPIRDAGGTAYRLVGQRQSAFWKFNKSQYGDRTITSYVASRDFGYIGRNALHTASELGEAVIDAPICQYVENLSFYNCTSLTNLTLNLPYAKFLGYELTRNTGIKGSASGWRLDSCTNVQPRTFCNLANLTGAIYLPSAAYIDHQAFKSCSALKGLVLGSENPSGAGLVHIGVYTNAMTDAKARGTESAAVENGRINDFNLLSVGYGLKLDFLVIGKGESVLLDDYAFSGITTISNIFFCGDMPTFGTTVFRHLPEKGAAIYIPKGNDSYASAIASVTAPSAEEQADFAANHAPGELIGMVNSQTYFGGNGGCKQYLAYGSYRQYLNDVVVSGTPSGVTVGTHPDLYWECNRTIRDVDTSSDCAIAAPDGILVGGTYRFVSGYVVKTATVDGWSEPVEHSGAVYVRPAGTTGTVSLNWIWSETAVTTFDLASPDDTTWPGDAVAFSYANGDPIPAGAYVLPGTITLSPSCAEHGDYPKNGFLRWENLPDGAVVDANNCVTFDFDGTQTGIRAVFRHDWVYDSAAGTIWNRRYRLNVASLGGSKLGIGTPDSMSGAVASGGNAFIIGDSMEAGGHLDLNGLVTDSSGSGSWTLSKIGYQSLAPWALTTADSKVSTYYPTHVRLPETLEAVQNEAMKAPAWDYTPLTNLVIRTPFLTDTGSNFAQGHRYLYRVSLDLPALTTLGQAFVNCGNVCLRDTDVTEWNLPNVQVVSSQAFGNNCSYPNVKGTLDLPKVHTLYGQALSALSGVETFILGTNGNTLVTIGDYAFWKCDSLKKLVIGSRSTLSVGTDILPSGTALEVVEFPDRIPANVGEFLDAVLSFKEISGPGDYVSVVCSRDRASGRLSPTALDSAEAAVAPEGAYGVYVTGDSGERKAWLVDNGVRMAGSILIVL